MSRRAIAAVIVTIGLGLWAGMALVDLQHARAAYRSAVEAAALPRLATAGGKTLVATGPDPARRDLARRIGDAAAAAGIRLSLGPLANSIDGIVALRIVARGDEAGLLRLSAAIEQDPAPVRWTRWSILPDGDGGLRLNADASAPWRTRNVTPAASGPLVTLAAAGPSPLPARSVFAPSAITGEAAASSGVPQLIGIVGRLPDDGVALLRLGDGATRGLRRGETAEGWTVADIAADRIRLTRAGRDHVEILPPTSPGQ